MPRFLRRATSHMNTILILNELDDIITVGAGNVYDFYVVVNDVLI